MGEGATFFAKNQAIMTDLLIFGAASICFLASLLALLLWEPLTEQANSSAQTAVAQMINLEGLSFTSVERLLDESEYVILKSKHNLSEFATDLRRDRRKLLLLWLSMVLRDLKSLRRFRHFLIQQGASTTVKEEWAIWKSMTFAVILLQSLRLSVSVLGPYIPAKMIRRARNSVDLMSKATATVLGRIPSAAWPDIERQWANARL
jgi:hypothetical protein